MEKDRILTAYFSYGGKLKGSITLIVKPGWNYAMLKRIIKKETGITATIRFPENAFSLKPTTIKSRKELRKARVELKKRRDKNYRRHPRQNFSYCYGFNAY